MPMIGVRQQLRALRMEKPHWSLGDLAHELGVTRERVRQLLNAEGLPTKRRRPTDVFDEAIQGLAPGSAPPEAHDTQEHKASDAGSAGSDTVGAGSESDRTVSASGSVGNG